MAKTVERCNKAMRFAVVLGDLTNEGTLLDLEQFAAERGVGVLINNAGVYSNGPFESMDDKQILDPLWVNLIAPICVTRRIYPYMKKQRSGVIVNINSAAGIRGGSGETIYAAAKHGLKGFSQTLRDEARPYNVQVMDVFPGAMNTTMLSHRNDLEDCIDVAEAAEIICTLLKQHASVSISDVYLNRVKPPEGQC